jgi:hypothetical protein
MTGGRAGGGVKPQGWGSGCNGSSRASVIGYHCAMRYARDRLNLHNQAPWRTPLGGCDTTGKFLTARRMVIAL